MDLARPTLLISLTLAALTLWYSGQWAGQDPRDADQRVDRTVATADLGSSTAN